jgi:hypothetical protein
MRSRTLGWSALAVLVPATVAILALDASSAPIRLKAMGGEGCDMSMCDMGGEHGEMCGMMCEMMGCPMGEECEAMCGEGGGGGGGGRPQGKMMESCEMGGEHGDMCEMDCDMGGDHGQPVLGAVRRW